ncbi:MAG: hypothetical protein AAFQ50_02460 [Pseudomonadota bacterium]
MEHDGTDFSAFLAAEDGAVTVDWVVLTAALVGLGLAVATVISQGLSDLSNDTSAQLADQNVLMRFASVGNLFNTDFASGPGDWLGGAVVSLAGFGEVLQVRDNETVELPFDVPAGATSATITFDVIGANDLDGDPATIMINGQPVAVYRDNHGTITTSDAGVSGVSVNVQQQYANNPVGAGDHGHDSRATYTITVDNPSGALTLGISSGTNDGLDDEFYAVDDVSVSTS